MALLSASITPTNLVTTSGAATLTNKTFSDNPTFSGGTVNGVPYLNGSKVLTTGSALTFDGTNLGVGTSSPAEKLDVVGTIKCTTTSLGEFTIFDAPSLGGYSLYQTAGVAMAYVGAARPVFGSGSSTDFAIVATAGNSLLLGAGNAERARIESSGNLLVGTTAQIGTEKFSVVSSGVSLTASLKGFSGATETIINIWNATTTGDAKFVQFITETGGTSRGTITYNRTAGLVAYNTTSDYRAKDISGPVTGSGALIDSIPVYMGTMKGATQARPMFIAHEVPAYAHTGEKDAVDEDGNPVYQQMDASALIPVMWAEIQSLRKRLADAGI